MDSTSTPSRDTIAAVPVDSLPAVVAIPCHAPTADNPAPIEPADVAQVGGKYVLTVVAVEGGGPDTLVRGHLVLEPTGAGYRQAPNPVVTHPWVGYSDVDLERLGELSLSYSPASRSQEDPGVQATHNSADKNLILMFGNAFNNRVMRFHQGVMFRVFSVSTQGLSGTWSGDYGPPPVPFGYWCAVRYPIE